LHHSPKCNPRNVAIFSPVKNAWSQSGHHDPANPLMAAY
jgi:hypothetical protein